MENFNIKGIDNNMHAILMATLETNIAIKAQTEFLIRHINNGQTEEENHKELLEIMEEAKKQTLERFYIMFGDLDIGSILGPK